MREYDESEFRDMSFEEFEQLIKDNDEIEIPIDDLQLIVPPIDLQNNLWSL